MKDQEKRESKAARKRRIKIEDLPKDLKVSREEMRKILGGTEIRPSPESPDPLLRDPVRPFSGQT